MLSDILEVMKLARSIYMNLDPSLSTAVRRRLIEALSHFNQGQNSIY